MFQFSYYKKKKKRPFDSLFRVTLFAFFCFLLLEMSPNRSAKELSSISKHKTVAMDMTEKTFVSDGLCSGVSYDAVGRELGVNESAACVKRGVLKQKHTQSEVVY